MHSRLAEILKEKHREVASLRKSGVLVRKDKDIPPLRDFKKAIHAPNKVSLIAEIKFASPSAGTIREDVDPIIIGQMYEKAGAAAISLLTDKRFFKGDLNNLPRLKRTISLPILRKDFIIDDIQVKESFLWGADAVLLIARILSKELLKRLLESCQDFGLAALTEVHDRDDLDKSMACGAEIIGINNRNLDTFEVDLHTTIRLAPLVPDRYILVSESGIHNAKNIRLLEGTGVEAVLVGSALMRSDDPAKKARELVDVGNQMRKKDGKG